MGKEPPVKFEGKKKIKRFVTRISERRKRRRRRHDSSEDSRD